MVFVVKQTHIHHVIKNHNNFFAAVSHFDCNDTPFCGNIQDVMALKYVRNVISVRLQTEMICNRKLEQRFAMHETIWSLLHLNLSEIGTLLEKFLKNILIEENIWKTHYSEQRIALSDCLVSLSTTGHYCCIRSVQIGVNCVQLSIYQFN